MDPVQAFDDQRPLLFSIAYRMLGSAAGPEDIVQDAFFAMAGFRCAAGIAESIPEHDCDAVVHLDRSRTNMRTDRRMDIMMPPVNATAISVPLIDFFKA